MGQNQPPRAAVRIPTQWTITVATLKIERRLIPDGIYSNPTVP